MMAYKRVDELPADAQAQLARVPRELVSLLVQLYPDEVNERAARAAEADHERHRLAEERAQLEQLADLVEAGSHGELGKALAAKVFVTGRSVSNLETLKCAIRRLPAQPARPGRRQ